MMTALILVALYFSTALSVSARNVQSSYSVGESESQLASPHQFPWLVSVRSFGWMHDCGGSLIALKDGQTESDIVISAAHCFGECFSHCAENGTSEEARKWCKGWISEMRKSIGTSSITVGEHSLNDEDPGEQRSSVASLRCDKLTTEDGVHFVNDIAVVKLSSPVKFTEKIRPIVLPAQGVTAEYTGCQVAGWGNMAYSYARDEFSYANATTPNEEMCSNWLKKNGYDPDLMLCSGKVWRVLPLNGGRRQVMCMDYSGGPLMCANKNGASTLVGVVSQVHRSCDEPGAPDISTKVTAYIDWIIKNGEEMTSVESK